ncbi:hypothetical protein SDC9_49214 [bioreactor metagenome]|uniref:Alkyl hydroperoxide reductase subunit C/ Thiol specific antioxidant domain-containing protein n=1 Tax=bioreactor metagenome TaxID=1076179 RepID=A0A644WGF1_9ZZZZ
MKLNVSDTMPNFSFQTPSQNCMNLKDAVGGKKTIVAFLRYFGCRATQVDLIDFTKGYQKLSDAGAGLLLVLQSDPKLLSQVFKNHPAPFTVAADPEQKLYHELEIAPAETKEILLGESEKWEAKKKRIAKLGLVHGEYEGEELQLPAVFVVDPGLKVLYAYYGKNIADVPGVEELLAVCRD